MSWDLDLSIGDRLDDVVWVLSINCASNGLGCSKDLLDGSFKFLGHRSWSHDSGDLDDGVNSEVSIVLHVLDLLAVTWWLLELLDDEGSSRWDNVDLGNTVLDGQFAGDLKTLPVLGGLGDVFSDLLWRQSKWSDLWGKSGGGSDFSSDATEVHDLNLSWVELWWHDE